MKILAVTPTYGEELRPETRASMEALALDGIELEWAVMDDQKFPPPDHRNVLHLYRRAQRRALAEGFDVLWTVEHDMVIPPDAALHLAATPGDIAYGVYVFRWGSYVLNTFEYVGDRNIGESLSLHQEKLKAALKRGVVRVSGAGWGCTWIKRRALEAWEWPEEWPENPAYDVAFAQRAVREKLRLYANFAVLCGHMKGGEVLWPGAYETGPLERNEWTLTLGGQQMAMYRAAGAGAVRVLARATMFVRVGRESVRIEQGREYSMAAEAAREHARAGYVEVVGHAA